MKPNTIYFFKPHLMPEKIGLIDPGDGVLNAGFCGKTRIPGWVKTGVDQHNEGNNGRKGRKGGPG